MATTAAVVLTGTRDAACRYNMTFTNIGTGTETLIITYSRASGTQRQFRQVTLDPDQTFEITGLPCNRADSVYAVTTTESVVDYLISVAPDEAPLASVIYDETGRPSNTPAILDQLALVLG